MLVIAPRPRVWIAYAIGNGAVFKAWQGEMAFRGKVWDFSQQSSIAKGRPLLSWSSDLARLPDRAGDLAASGWTTESVSLGADCWSFSGGGAALTSPPFDARGWTRLFVAYEEISRKGPVRVEVSDDGGASWDAQWFESTMHGSRDDQWQWGFKEIAVAPTAAMRVRFRQLDPSYEKRLRNVRVFGDHVAWWTEREGRAEPAPVEWVGHELIRRTEGVVLRTSVGGEAVTETLDATIDSGTLRLV